MPECKGQKIAVLDIGKFAASRKFPTCNYSNVVVNSRDGTAYVEAARERLGQFAADHTLGAHAAPW